MVLTADIPDVGLITGSAVTTRVVLVLEYDGTRYHGSQWQADMPTVQEEIEKALRKLTGEKTRVTSASRTDAGVHARGQVVSFRTASPHPPETFISGLNYYLPPDVAVRTAYRVRDSFNVRRQAVSREYDYYILNSPVRSPLREGFSYRVGGRLDIEVMNQACQALIGEHDLASFMSGTGAGVKSTVRRVYRAEIRRDGDMAVFNMVANSFLPHQVRNTAGALIRVGLGKMDVAGFVDIMAAKRPGLAGPAAPACGLFLTRVNYPRPLAEETV
ncbi:MAG: tRNA pseudouridine(38-40) synthase TruA [Dehalococcoidales bacterium]|nr:tRNA pseudouridine(38-40) synthase TruA [Dehalococcoidales bacterium]MDZ4230799.1 tRNA pseudouridine(38-40) synthase TruA [Dehalococcoidales bacterium]